MRDARESRLTRIAVVDDDVAVRESVAAVLERPDRQVDVFADGRTFLEGCDRDRPDAALLDLRMPGLSGLEVLRRLAPLSFPVVMMSAHADVQAAVQAIKLGASDFVEKPFRPSQIEDTLAALERSEGPAASEGFDALLSPLTPRERDVALALHEGLTNKEIARAFGCSPRTVEVHRARVFEKLEVRNVAGLVKRISQTEAHAPHG